MHQLERDRREWITWQKRFRPQRLLRDWWDTKMTIKEAKQLYEEASTHLDVFERHMLVCQFLGPPHERRADPVFRSSRPEHPVSTSRQNGGLIGRLDSLQGQVNALKVALDGYLSVHQIHWHQGCANMACSSSLPHHPAPSSHGSEEHETRRSGRLSRSLSDEDSTSDLSRPDPMQMERYRQEAESHMAVRSNAQNMNQTK